MEVVLRDVLSQDAALCTFTRVPAGNAPRPAGKAGALVSVFFLLSGDHTWTSRSQARPHSKSRSNLRNQLLRRGSSRQLMMSWASRF